MSNKVLDTKGHGPDGSSVLRVNVMVPKLVAMGVKVTDDGVMVAPVLLNWLAELFMLPVTAVIDHVPLEAPPPTLEPERV